jgi:hypothetical protein
MNKIIFTLLASFPLWAFTPEETVSELEKINQSPASALCERNQDQLYTPSEAINDINSGKLTFVGRALFPGNDQNYSCVYKSQTAFIIYNNCLSSKKESAATDLEVLSFNGDLIGFTILNKSSTPAASSRVRADYDSTWRISVTPSQPVSANLTMEQLKKLIGNLHEVQEGCLIGRTFEAQKLDSQVFCQGNKNYPAWKSEAEKFWKDPKEDWYKTLKYLREVIVATKF